MAECFVCMCFLCCACMCIISLCICARARMRTSAPWAPMCLILWLLPRLKIYDLGYGVHGGHIKLQNSLLLRPALFLFHGWHFIFYLLLLFNSIFPLSFLALDCPGSVIDHSSSALESPISAIVVFKQCSFCVPLDKVRQWDEFGAVWPLSPLHFTPLFWLSSPETAEGLWTCSFRLKRKPHKLKFGVWKARAGRPSRSVPNLWGECWKPCSSDHRCIWVNYSADSAPAPVIRIINGLKLYWTGWDANTELMGEYRVSWCLAWLT